MLFRGRVSHYSGQDKALFQIKRLLRRQGEITPVPGCSQLSVTQTQATDTARGAGAGRCGWAKGGVGTERGFAWGDGHTIRVQVMFR